MLRTRLLRRLIRRKALWSGIFGPSKFWRVVAVWVFGRATLAKFFGKQPETLAVAKLGTGRLLSVETEPPLTRRRKRKLARSGVAVPTKRDYEAAAWALVRSRKAS